jgi:hypothetical protein
VTYADGRSALDGPQSDPPDLAILDIKMPRMDGMETLRRLREKSDGHTDILLCVLVRTRFRPQPRQGRPRVGARCADFFRNHASLCRAGAAWFGGVGHESCSTKILIAAVPRAAMSTAKTITASRQVRRNVSRLPILDCCMLKLDAAMRVS